MCGIVGLLVKKPELRAQLGEWMLPMMIGPVKFTLLML